MNNENNNIENNDNGFLPGVNNSNTNNDNNFLPGFDGSLNNSNQFHPNEPQFNPLESSNQFNVNQVPNMEPNQFNMNQTPNMGPNQFDMNQVPNMGPNQFDMNQIPNMGPNQFNMNQVPNMEPNQFDVNQVPNMGPNQFDMNQVPNMEPNQFDMNQVPNMEPNQFDVNQVPNIGPNQFDMNQVPNMEPNQFDMNQNPNNDFNSDMNSNFNQGQYSDYTEDFTRTWMGSIYNKANSKKFNWCAAFFGPAYLFYRKVYLTGGLATLIFIIINVILALLKLENPLIILGVDVILSLIYFFGLGLGFYPIYKDFVHKQLEKYKKQFADNDQLVAVASKKGGTSVAGVVVYFIIVAILSSVISFMTIGSLFSSLIPKTPQTPVANQTTPTNEIQEALTDDFNFADNYIISYPVATWTVGTDNKSLISGNYSLSYRVTYKSSDLGITDMSSADGRASVLKIINNSVTALATANNLHMEPDENFTRKNNVYYTYIDLSSDTEITRYYFILVPDDNVLFQFELNVDDTAVDYDTNTEVNDMLTNITKDISLDENENNTILSNEINDTISNSIAVNETNSIDNTVTSNTVEETNNTITNDLNSVVPPNNTVTENSLNEPASNNSINSSLGILQDID